MGLVSHAKTSAIRHHSARLELKQLQAAAESVHPSVSSQDLALLETYKKSLDFSDKALQKYVM